MKIDRKVLKEVVYPYAVSVYECGGRKKVVTATELDGPCSAFWTDTLEEETLWEGQGGTMNTWQLSDRGDFLAIQRFYKGFNSRASRIARVEPKDGEWVQSVVCDIPFLHRFGVVGKGEDRYLVCCVLCRDKESREDWSQAGWIQVAKLPEPGEQPEFRVLIPGIHRNHAFFYGQFDGTDRILAGGDEGLFQIDYPRDGSDWRFEKLIDRPVSDVTSFDLDGDGEDELVTIEPFHGSKVVVSKRINGVWETVWSSPTSFGHAIWSGTIFGEPAFIIGHRAEDMSLLLFRPRGWKEGKLAMDITVLDQWEGPTNVAVVHGDKKEQVFSCNGAKNRIVLYELTE